jgi:arylsulfatase
VDLEPFRGDYPERFDRLPDNFDDDLYTKPEIQRMWRWVRNREHFVGAMDPDEPRQWLRQLDYYAWLHERLDGSLSTVLAALDRLGIYDDTAIVYTSDHGDACGAHGLRAKLPCVYEEVMGVPLTVKVPGVTQAGATTDALSTHVDLAATVCGLGGVGVDGSGPSARETLAGTDLGPTLADPSASVRDHVLFAQDSAQSPLLRGCRYAVRGLFDGHTKYARYYGIGGGVQRDGTVDEVGKVVAVDAPFDDQDHELYDCDDDPGELINRAHDRSRRREIRDQYERLVEYESAEFAPLDPA